MSKELVEVNPLNELSTYLKTDPKVLAEVLKKTAFANCTTDEDFVSCVIVANTYKLNPLLGQIHAFRGKNGAIKPVVSIDGWAKLVTTHPDYDGVEFEDIRENGKLIAITTKLYVKNKRMPTSVTEYLDECKRDIDTWRKWPYRMLRHKSYSQCARIAFGFSGIYDEDEAERIDSVTDIPAGKPDVSMPKAKDEEPKKEEVKKENVIDAEVVETKKDEEDADIPFGEEAKKEVASISALKSAQNGDKLTVKAFVKDYIVKQTKTGKPFTTITVINSYSGASPAETTINSWGKKELNKGLEYEFDVEVKIITKDGKTKRNYLAEKISEVADGE